MREAGSEMSNHPVKVGAVSHRGVQQGGDAGFGVSAGNRIMFWRVEKKKSHLVSRVERQAAASSKRHRAAEQESQEDSFSCRSLYGSAESI